MKGQVWRKIIGISMALVLMVPSVVMAATTTAFDFDKDEIITRVNNEFVLTLEGLEVKDLYGFEVALSYDETDVAIVGKPSVTAIEGFSVGPKRANDDKVYFGCTQIGTKSGINGNIDLGELTFKVKSEGEHTITLESVTVVDSKMKSVKYPVEEKVTVKAAPGVDASASLKDITGHWAEESIRKVVNAGYMIGKTETLFNPKDNLTRGEMAVILNRIVGGKEVAANSFKDIQGDEWYAESILKMSAKGLIKGYEDSTFRPKNNITRAETIALLARKAQSEYTYQDPKSIDTILDQYKDATQVPTWARAEVAWSIESEIIKGDSSNKLNMKSNITRAEFAVILCRLLNL